MKFYITIACAFCLTYFLFGCASEKTKENQKAKPETISEVVPETIPQETQKEFPKGIQKLMKAYPDFIIGGTSDSILWYDGTTMLYDDKNTSKPFEVLLNAPDLQDHFTFDYPKGELKKSPARNQDPGRIRYESFFKKMYGANPKAVQSNFTLVTWLPSTLNKKIYATKINGVARQLQKVSDELDGKPHLNKYLANIGGVFNWRKIAGTERLSSHSFGITIDINTKYANYWKWTSKNVKESDVIAYQNQIPYEIVAIFEKHGFIWGGKWYHYDTMHFEYRPELLVE